ncbi:NAD(P)H-binding protein [Spirosoma humi]
MFAILGITGQVGGATARALLTAGQPVRAVLRNPLKAKEWTAQGAQVALADLHDSTALQAAFADVAGAFVATPPLVSVEDPLGENRLMVTALSTALLAAGVPKVVYLSSVGAQHDRGLGAIGKLHDMEQAFNQLPLPTAAIRAAWFMENFQALLEPARQSGQVVSLLQPTDRPIPMVATQDIGQLAATTLRESWTGPRVLELGGPCSYSPDDVTACLSYLLNRPLRTVVVPAANHPDIYRSWGMSAAAATLMTEMIAGFNRGWIDFAHVGTESHAGRTLLEDALRQFVVTGSR